MAWISVPLPKLIYRSADEDQLGGQLGAKLVNGYIDELGHIRKRPGLTEWVDLGSGRVQGLYWWDSKKVLIAVVDGNIFKITTTSGANSDVGGTDLNSNVLVSFATDGSRLVMANKGEMIVYDNSNAPAAMTGDERPTTVSHVAYKDGYLLAVDTSTSGRVAFSSPLSIQGWTASDIFTAETNPDAIQFLDTRWREVTIFGERGIDIYFNDGTTPFSRIDGAYTERGCIAKDTVQMLDSGWIWLDDLRRVTTIVTGARQPQDLSTPFDDQIRDVTGVSSASALTIDHGVRKFYALTFPDAEKTFVHDLSTQTWAEWATFNDRGDQLKYPGLTSVYARSWNFIVVGDYTNGKLYKVDSSNFQDDGANVRLIVRTGHIDHGTSNRKRSKKLRLRIKRGTGTTGSTTDQGYLQIKWRDDNGPWSKWHVRSLGHAGDNDFYITFTRMGIYRTRQYEIVHNHNSDFILMGIQEDQEDLGR